MTPAVEWVSECKSVRLILGDCREVLPGLHACVADVLCTDPGYGLDKGKGTLGKRGRAARVTWSDTVEDVRQTYVPVVKRSLALTGGRGIVTPGTPHCFEYPKPRDIGCIYQPCSPGVSSWGRATWQPVLFYGKDPRAGKHLDPVSLVNVQPAEESIHPCPKPMVVARWMVRRAAMPGETIIDPFFGSGMFGVAAIMHGCSFIGCEINCEYFDEAVGRIQAALDSQPLFRDVEPQETQAEMFGSPQT